MNLFFEALNKSEWKGVIAEVGIGLEFSSRLLRVPGASNTVIQVICDYAGLDRKQTTRAVSLENAKDMAHRALAKAKSNLAEGEDPNTRFGLAITGAHYNDKPSHAYVYLATPKWNAYMHFSTPASDEREHVGNIVSQKIQWFLNACLLSTEPWRNQILAINKVDNIDILYGPGIGDAERLLLLTPNNPLVYHKGHFQRVTDYVRAYKLIYPGSFNPPTKAHLAVENCLFEISQQHFYKGAVSIEDMIHRMKMLDAEGRPVLLTQAPMMINKCDLILEHGVNDPCIVMGSDAWNMFTAVHQYPSIDWLSERLPNVSFFVRGRKNIPIEINGITHTLKWKNEPTLEQTDCSATDVRTSAIPADHPMLTSAVAHYVRRNRLYLSS